MNVPRVTDISGSQWHQIVNGATETAIISTDQQGNVTSWNTGASRLLGWTEEEMLGQSLSRIFGEEEPGARLNREIDDAVRHGRGGGEEGWRLRKDGSRFWVVGELSPIRDGTKIVGFIKILRDRTAQREAEQEIHEERRALEILNRAGSVLAVETDLERLVQVVTDAGVELTGAEFGAFFYNVINTAGESYMLYTLSGVPIEAFSKPDVRSYSAEILRELGYRVLEAHDGPSALRTLEQHPRVDLLFTDVVLPGGVTGAQVAAQAKASRPRLKVLFTTGYARNAIIHHGRLDKGVQLITKPFSFNDLAGKVRDMLDN